MADNTQLPATGTGTGDIIVATDKIAGVDYQRIKLIEGADGVNDGDVCAANPLPVEGTLTLSAVDNAVLDTIDAAIDTINAKLVTGTVIGDVNLGATDNAVLDTIAAKDFATQTTLAAMNAKLVTGTVIGDVNLGATDNAVLDGLETHLHSIDGKLVTGTVIGDVNLGATDNAVLDTMVTALQLIDNSVDGNYQNVNLNIAGTDVAANNGAASAQTQRVTIANDSTGVLATVSTVTTVGTVTTCNLAAETTKVIGTVRVASGGIASGGIASGAVASGAIASGAVASGAIASGAAVSGAFADGSLVTLGAKADAKSTATDATAITLMQVAKQISASSQLNVQVATTPAIYNVTMTNADTEYSQALPANTKKFIIQTRDGTEFRLAYVTGKVATPTAPWFTVRMNGTYSEDNLTCAAQTLYFGCGDAAKIIEIIAWS